MKIEVLSNEESFSSPQWKENELVLERQGSSKHIRGGKSTHKAPVCIFNAVLYYQAHCSWVLNLSS